jgi:hypothetical protein
MIRRTSADSGIEETVSEASPVIAVMTDPAASQVVDPPEIASFSVDEIRAELASRQRSITKLEREKARLRARIRAIDAEVAELIGTDSEAPAFVPLPTVVRLPLSDLPLGEAISKVFDIGDEFSPAVAEERLLARSYSSRVANLRTSITQVLSREMRFKRVARGVYLRTA